MLTHFTDIYVALGGDDLTRWLKSVAFKIAIFLIKSHVLWTKLNVLSLIRYPAIQLAKAYNPDIVLKGIFS